MGWRIVQQPNGFFARFSEIVDDFTDCDMSQDEAVTLCIEKYQMGRDDALWKVQRGVGAGRSRFDEAIEIIRDEHGQERANECVMQMSVVRSSTNSGSD